MTYLPRKVQKIGNSLYISIPSDIVKELNILPDERLLFNMKGGDIILRSPRFGSLKERKMAKLRQENDFSKHYIS